MYVQLGSPIHSFGNQMIDMYVYVHAYIHKCMLICFHIYICILYIYICIYSYTYMYVYVHIYICVNEREGTADTLTRILSPPLPPPLSPPPLPPFHPPPPLVTTSASEPAGAQMLRLVPSSPPRRCETAGSERWNQRVHVHMCIYKYKNMCRAMAEAHHCNTYEIVS